MGIQKLATILEFVEGASAGYHNFIVVVSESPELDAEYKSMFQNSGYVVFFPDLSSEKAREEVERLFVHAQSYMDLTKLPEDLPQGRVGIIFSKDVWRELLKSPVRSTYLANRAYMNIIEGV